MECIVDECAADAIGELSAEATGFMAGDRAWILARSASSLPEIEEGTRRLVTIRQADSVTRAAATCEAAACSLP